MYVLAALLAAAAAWCWLPADTPARRLLRLRPPDDRFLRSSGEGLGRDPGEGAPRWFERPDRRPPDRRTLVYAACAGLLTGLAVGGLVGVAAGVLVSMGAGWVLHRQEPQVVRLERRKVEADLPFAADLMVACLMAGQPVSTAVDTAAEAVPGPLATRLSWVRTQLRLGAEAEPTWAYLARDPATAPLARAMTRAALSGAPVADVLTRLADDAREESRAASLAAARRVAVKAVAPLGLCFLPAFVLLGVVPIIAGLASTIVLP
ncbi:type II secretion system F family protein [Nonomuraea sp. NPDC050790]|uniref:type II secretion system F family protein n=1 Tax=Nonomuraea sp. NPDC050790 TaxID=3364371 RepID=UPI0037A7A3F4